MDVPVDDWSPPEPGMNLTCAWWDEDAEEWSTEGVTVHSENRRLAEVMFALEDNQQQTSTHRPEMQSHDQTQEGEPTSGETKEGELREGEPTSGETKEGELRDTLTCDSTHLTVFAAVWTKVPKADHSGTQGDKTNEQVDASAQEGQQRDNTQIQEVSGSASAAWFMCALSVAMHLARAAKFVV